MIPQFARVQGTARFSFRPLLGLVFILLSIPGCLCPGPCERGEQLDREMVVSRAGVNAALDALHQAASEADGAAYFALFDAGATYYGTDASERWSVEEFQAYAQPYFSAGRGWTYQPTERHVDFSPHGDTAWFDERLQNDAYGETRGSGVLIRRGPPGSPWLITQYNLSFPVPNELTRDLVQRIRELPGGD